MPGEMGYATRMGVRPKRRGVMKKQWLLAVGLLVGLAGGAFAANYGDTFQITFTPTGDRGVYIDSSTVPLGDLALGASYVTDAIPTHSTGTVANIEYSS